MSLKCLVTLSIVTLFGILIFGLNPKDFRFSNKVSWIKDFPGIRFDKYGLIYTDPFIEPVEGSISGSGDTVTYTPPAVTQMQTFTITVTVTDDQGGSTTAPVNVTVEPVAGG